MHCICALPLNSIRRRSPRLFCACRSSGAPADRRAGGPVVLSARPRARRPSSEEGRTGDPCAPRVLLPELRGFARAEHAAGERGRAELRVPSRLRHARQPVRAASRVQAAAARHLRLLIPPARPYVQHVRSTGGWQQQWRQWQVRLS